MRMKRLSLLAGIAVLAASASAAMAAGWSDDFNSYTIGQPLSSPWVYPAGATDPLIVVSDGAGGGCVMENGATTATMRRAFGSPDITTYRAQMKSTPEGGALAVGLGSTQDSSAYLVFQMLSTSDGGTDLQLLYTNGGGEQPHVVNIPGNNWYDLMLEKNGTKWNASYKLSADTSWTAFGSSNDVATMDFAMIRLYSGWNGGTGHQYIDNVSVSSPAAPVPEPSSVILLLTGAAGLIGLRKRK